MKNTHPQAGPASATQTRAADARVLPLQGASNCRDLGGYPGRDGRLLRWRRVLRSDRLDLC